jgi:hypothetical protein
MSRRVSILSDHLHPHIFIILSLQTLLSRVMLYTSYNAGHSRCQCFSYRMEHMMGELNYWTDLMTRWGVEWIAGSENKAHDI